MIKKGFLPAKSLKSFKNLKSPKKSYTQVDNSHAQKTASTTKGGLARCKADGIVLGRPRGAARTLGLDAQAKKIDEFLALKLNKRAMAKLLDVSPNTLYDWLRRRRPAVMAKHADTSAAAAS